MTKKNQYKNFQFNSFGKYKYRSAEDIKEAVKPIVIKYDFSINTSSEVVYIGERYYIQASATLTCTESGDRITSTAYAREQETQKGMNEAQITGSSDSYATKYALGHLLGLDDTKDSDSNKPEDNEKVDFTPEHEKWDSNKALILDGKLTINRLKEKYTLSAENEKKLTN